MPRIARVVVPNFPHHITQRGNRRQRTFFSKRDYQYYLRLALEAREKALVEVWAYCLMPNHVHMILVPRAGDGLSKYLAPIHHKYALTVNKRKQWKGHFWQERFYSTAMDENYLLQAVRYVELNPVRAKLCDKAQDWKWSSARAHFSGKNDDLVVVKPLLERINDWPAFLSDYSDSDDELRKHTRTGRPIGEDDFLRQVEALTGRRLRKKKPGPGTVK